MHIEWGQIVTHIIGFLIALWLLRRYAWNSILGFVEKRRETIAQSFAEIEEGKAAIESQKAQYAQELEKIEETRRVRIQDGAREAEELAGEIKEEARREALESREKAKQDIAIELDKANEILKDRIVETVLAATEKIIREKLDKDQHNKLIHDALKQLEVK